MSSADYASWALHFLLAALWTFIICLSTGDALAGSLSASLFFLAREVTQRQFMLKAETGLSLKEQPLWYGFDIVNWSVDRRMDALSAFFGAAAMHVAWRFDAWGLLITRVIL